MVSRRGRAWADRRFDVSSLVAAVPQSFNLLQNAPTVDTLTAVRVIGDLTFQYSPNSTIVDSLSKVDVGVGVTSLEAFTVGGASLPNPSDENQYPPRGWLYVSTQPVYQQAESTGVINAVARFQFDLRAMRKVDKGVLFLTMEQNNILVGGSMRIVGRTRVLCLT